jgi:hypothetical protein
MANIDNYIFKVLSFNVDSGGLDKTQGIPNIKTKIKESFLSFLQHEFNITKSNKPIFLISLQEDENPSVLYDDNNLQQILQKNNYKLSIKSSLSNIPTLTPVEPINPVSPSVFAQATKKITNLIVRTTTFIEKSKRILTHEKNFIIHNIILYPLSLKLTFIQNVILHSKVAGLINTKASVIQQFTLSKTDIYFIASHLSIKTGELDTLGYDDRKKLMDIVISNISDKLKQSTNSYIILWGGDLNFRFDSDINTPEQLTRFLKTKENDPLYKFEDLTMIDKIQPTCKINVETKNTCNYRCLCKDKQCIKCITPKCFDSTRIPSYCDRILAMTSSTQKSKYKFESKPESNILTYEFTKYSDHNPIYNTIRYYKPFSLFQQKYLKYKKKYLKLKNLNSKF